MLKEQEQWIDYQAPCLGGWNNFLEAEAIGDQDAADVLNVVYDGGFLSPRPGSVLFAAKPTGETAAPLQIMEAITSDGLEYLVAVYGASFYVRNPLTETWVKINQTYTPTETDVYWGYINWNNGRGDDRLYGCNGIDSFFRWDMCITTVGAAATAGDSTVEVTDGTRFPAGGGTLIIKSGGDEHTEAYTSRTGNVFTLTGTLSEDIAEGESVTLDMIEKASMEKGKILSRHQSRLIVANKFGAETAGWYTVTNSPEDFTVASTVNGASTFVIADGNGGITGLHDFGTFLLIEKEDSHHRLEIIIADDLGSKLDKIQPIISGTSVGTTSQQSTIKMLNGLYYPTRTEGFIQLDPRTSGDSASTGIEVISRKIQNYATENVTYEKCKGVAYRQNAVWAVARKGAAENTFILVYDTLRDAWSRFSGWAVTDFGRVNDKLYYLENGTGNVIECFTKSFNDLNNPYQVSAYTKRFNFGLMSQAKRSDLMYVQGYMTPASEFFIDVFYNEDGINGKQTFKFFKDAEGLLYSDPVTNSLGQPILGEAALGYVSLLEVGNVSFFRTHLSLDLSRGFYNVQARMYSNKEAFWAVTGIGFAPVPVKVADNSMVMSPIVNTI